MFANLKGLFSPSNKDLRKRILFTLMCLAIFALGTNIIIPGAKSITNNIGFLELLSLVSGGNLKTFSIFSLGVMPYITASIITQLLQMDIIPYFKELKESGATGRQKINKINRYLGMFLAFVQAYVFSLTLLKGDAMTTIKSTVYLTAGTAFLIWLGDEMTKKGIGNGMSLIIMAGIVNNLPSTFITAFQNLIINGSYNMTSGIILFVLFIIVYLAIILGVVYMQIAERRIPIQYSNRTSGAYAGEKSYIPIKLNTASVVPVIFASAIIGIPSVIANILNKEAFTNFVNNYIVYTSYTGFILYMLLIFVFGYFYTLLELNPDEMAENLDTNRSYIPGIVPGEATSKYLKYVITRISTFGTLGLMVIAALPIIFTKFSNLPSNVTLGGTGLIIVVGVALETYKQLESSIISRSYTGSRKRRRSK